MTEENQDPMKSRPAALDLDALERDGGVPPVFDFVLGGRRYLMSDPQEIDWQDLIAGMGNPVLFFRRVLPPEDRDEFFKAHLPGWKLRRLMKDYQDHYNLPDVGNAGGLPR